MEISVEKIKELRERTKAGVMDCKSALQDAQGDMERSVEILLERGLASAARKANRVASQGLVEAYIHAGGRIGSMVEVSCETDFVARTDEFKGLAHDLAMQVAATGPKSIDVKDAPPEEKTNPNEDYLLLQPFIKDPTKTVQDVILEAIAKVGENINVKRFARFELGN